jgi:type II secretory pathway component PulL
MSRKILGLDIRSDAVSAVLVRSGIKKTVIEAHEYVSLTDHPDSEIGLASALETIVGKLDISGSICVAAFPADQVSYRNIKVPFKGQKKIMKILPYELEPSFPFQVDDLIIDFHTMNLSDHDNQTELIAVAVEKSKLQSYLDTLAGFNIDPEIVTVGGFPSVRCLTNLVDIRKDVLFIDLDGHKASVFVVLSGEVCLIRSFPWQFKANLSNEESLAANIKRTLFAFEEVYGSDFQPEGILITGSGFPGVDFEQDLTQLMEIPVKQTDLIRDTGIIKQPVSTHLWNPHQMDNALSLALIEIEGIDTFNFRTGPFSTQKFWGEHKKSLIKTGVLMALVLLLAFSNLILDSYFMEKKLNRLDDQITHAFTSTFPEVKKIVDPFQQMQMKMKEAREKALLPGETGTYIRTVDILNDISKFITKETDVKLTRLVIGPENVTLSGNTDTFNSVDGIKSGLEQSESFKKITISSANIDKSDNRVRFKLKVQL